MDDSDRIKYWQPFSIARMTVAAVVFAFSFSTAKSYSDSPAKSYSDSTAKSHSEERLSIETGFSKILRLDRPASEIVVGNPNIAGVSLSRETDVIVNARAIGATNLIAFGGDGEEIAHYRVTVVPVSPDAPPQSASAEIATDYTVTVVSGAQSVQTFICDPVRGCDPRGAGNAGDRSSGSVPEVPPATPGGQGLPTYNAEDWCQQVSAVGGSPSNVLYNSCLEREQSAYDNLQQSWGQVPQQTRNWCDEVARAGGEGSYITLQSCIEREIQAGAATPTFRQ